MIEFGIWHFPVRILAILVGYAVAASALLTYSRNNIQPMAYLGVGLVFLTTTFVLPSSPSHWASPSTILSINYILLFSCYIAIGYCIVLIRDQSRGGDI